MAITKRHWLLRFLAGGSLAICIVVALVWWQERGLDVVEQRLGAGDVDGALAVVDAYLAKHPSDERGIALRARALVLADDPQQAALLFEQVGAAEIDDLRAWSTALLTLKQWGRALPILSRIMQIDPSDGQTLERITICHFELGQRQAALDAGHRLAELAGFEAAGHLQLASIYTEWNSSLIAGRYFKNVLKYRPDATGLPLIPTEFFLAYADNLLATGNARQALEILESRDELPIVDASVRKGEAWLLIGKLEQARECFERAVQLEPSGQQQSESRQRLAEIEIEQGEAKRAIEWLQPLVDRQGLNADGAFLLVRAYTELGDEVLVDQWHKKTTALRLAERRLRALQVDVANAPATPRSRTISAYVAAANHDWKTAGQLLASLLRDVPAAYEQPFVQQLVEAVRKQDTLPALESMPPRPDQSLPSSDPDQ